MTYTMTAAVIVYVMKQALLNLPVRLDVMNIRKYCLSQSSPLENYTVVASSDLRAVTTTNNKLFDSSLCHLAIMVSV